MIVVVLIFFSLFCSLYSSEFQKSESPCVQWSKNIIYYAKKSTCLFKHKHVTSDFKTFEWDDIVRTEDGNMWEYDPEHADFVPTSLQHILSARTVIHLHTYQFPCGPSSWRLKMPTAQGTQLLSYENGQWHITKKGT